MAEKAMTDLMFGGSREVTLDAISDVQSLMRAEGMDEEQIMRWGAFMRLRLPSSQHLHARPHPCQKGRCVFNK